MDRIKVVNRALLIGAGGLLAGILMQVMFVVWGVDTQELLSLGFDPATLLSKLSIVMIGLSFIARLFFVSESLDVEEYSFWRKTLILGGIILWPLFTAFIAFAMLFTGSLSGIAFTFWMFFGGLFITLNCLFVAIYFYGQSKVRVAVHILKIPFYCLVTLIIGPILY